MISVLYTIILITNFKLIEMCIKSSQRGRGLTPKIISPGFSLVGRGLTPKESPLASLW